MIIMIMYILVSVTIASFIVQRRSLWPGYLTADNHRWWFYIPVSSAPLANFKNGNKRVKKKIIVLH